MHVQAARGSLSLWIVFLLAGTPAQAAAPPLDLAGRARAVLSRHCAGCHGQTQPKGGLGHISDLARLIDRGLVIPGKALDSPLFRRVHDGEMPPPKKRASFSSREVGLLRVWIDRGAPTGQTISNRIVSEADLLSRVKTDLRALPPRQRRFIRYLALAHFATRPANERQTVRHALAKVVNSLSWHARLTMPHSVGGDGLLWRIDLRHYRWTARQWDSLTAQYPYRPTEPTPIARDLAALADCNQPVIRADWFIATASRPPFYHDFLQLPSGDRALERQLQVDVEDGTPVRLGFNGSGVARFNRVLERHDALHGAYWRSYDFSDNTSRQKGNIFELPLGPRQGQGGFRHAGGELIFHLPNGLQGYLLVDADGRRIDRAPAEIVSDPKRPDRIVENGLSCIGCHVGGILPKDDQVRAHVSKNPRAFSDEDRATILELYPPADTLRKLVQEDNDRFMAALKRLGVPATEPEPVITVVLGYEDVLNLSRAADELGVKASDMPSVLRQAPELSRSLGPLLARGGSVQRLVFEEAYQRLLPPASGNTTAESVVTASGPFRGPRGSTGAVAWSPDGKSFASGAADGEVRVWDVADGKSRLIGRHTDEVRALAFSPDGRLLLSGGADRVVSVWDVATGGRAARLVGHTAAVRALAATPNSKFAVSAGEDRTLRTWDLATGKQLLAWTAHARPVTALAVNDDGRLVLSGGADRSARLWDLATGEARVRVEHTNEVHAVAFSPDGSRALSAGADRSLSVWDVRSGKLLRQLNGHAGTVGSAVFSADGREALSACVLREGQAVYRHEVAGGRLLNNGGAGPVEAAAVRRDGRVLLAADGTIHLIHLSERR